MHDTGLESGTGEGTLGRQVVVACAFHDDDGVLNVVLLLGLANLLYRQLKESRLMLKRLRLDEQVSKIVGHHPLGTMLGWIDTHDSKPFTSHLPDARADDAIRLLQTLSFA